MWIGELIWTQNFHHSRLQRVVCLEYLDFHCFDLSSLCGLGFDDLHDRWTFSASFEYLQGDRLKFDKWGSNFVLKYKKIWKRLKLLKKIETSKKPSHNQNCSRELQGLHMICREILPVMHESFNPEPPHRSLAKRCCCSTFYVLETMCLPSSDDRVKRREFHLFYIET